MSGSTLEPGLVLPKPQTARIFGTLNIIFAAILLFFAYTSVFTLLFAPAGAAVMKAWQKGLERQIRGARVAQIRRLETLKATATTDAKRAQYEAQLAATKAQPTPSLGGMAMGFEQLEEPKIRNYSLVDAGIGAILNAALLVAGLGLIRLREWARKASLAIAGLKLAWILAGTVYMVAIIFPIQSRLAMKQMQATMTVQTKGGTAATPFNPQQMSQFVMASSTASALFMVVLSAAYPALSLWFLSRPPVRAACLAKPAGKGGREWSS